jgi:iron complex transport system substrate-binding protein
MNTMSRLRLPVAVLLVLGLLLGAVALAACGGEDDGASPSPAAAGPVTVTDDADAEVVLDQPAERVVSLAPANTEIAYAIGGGDKLVGVTTYCDYPQEATSKPTIGDFANPNVEKIVSMEPDLVLAAGGIQASLRTKFEDLGIAVYVVDPVTYAETQATIAELGQLLGLEDEAKAVTDEMQAAADEVGQQVEGLDTPSVFFEVYPKPMMTAGSGTLIDDLVTMAGGVNIGAEAGEGYPSYSTEVLLQQDPQIYIAPKGNQMDPGDIAARPGFDKLSAVADGAVFIVEDNLVVRPGPRMAQGLQELARMIHPEAFADEGQ